MIFWFSAQPDLTVSSDDRIDFIVRKAAHMAEYGCLFLLTTWLLAVTFGVRAGWRRVALAGALVLAYACSDEYHQTFVRGRVGHPPDVAIDMTGVIVTYVAYVLITRKGTPWRRPRT
jgi:VanZ family protein